MPQTNRVDFARKSFAAKRQIAEHNLAKIRKEARALLDFRHNRTTANPVARLFLQVPYLWKKRELVPLLRETHWKMHFYRRVEADLERGDLGSAIEALSLFAPREETPNELVKRVMANPVTLSGILNSPHILRVNMLRLRDDLIKVQQERAG